MWEIKYTQKASKTILKLDPSIREKIKKGIEELYLTPNLGKQLTGPLKGLRSLRVGDYRVIYKKEKNQFIILVVAVGHRKDIYE